MSSVILFSYHSAALLTLGELHPCGKFGVYDVEPQACLMGVGYLVGLLLWYVFQRRWLKA